MKPYYVVILRLETIVSICLSKRIAVFINLSSIQERIAIIVFHGGVNLSRPAREAHRDFVYTFRSHFVLSRR